MSSFSEKFLQNRERPPQLTPNMWKQVSNERRESLEKETEAGAFTEGSGSDRHFLSSGVGMSKTALGNAISGRNKVAQTFGGSDSVTKTGGGAGWGGSGGSVRQNQEVYSPLWLNSNLNLPRDRATINAWSRSFFALNPLVQNAISLHSTYPISKLNIKCKNPKIAQFFNDMADEIDLFNTCIQIGQEYWALGECFPYADLNESTGKWNHILIQNPDYITVQRSVVAGEPIISIRPDQNLIRICTSNRPSDIQQRQLLDPAIVEHIRKGENIPVSNFNISHIARKISPYETRGTSLIVSCFRSLMLFDKIRECKFAQADNMVNPLTLIKVGGGGDQFKATPADLEQVRDTFVEAQYDKNFKIFTHDGVTVEPVGIGSGIYDTTNDVNQLVKEIYVGLMAPTVLMDGGGDVTYANGGITLDVLRQRYMSFRNMLSAWLRRKIFAPISQINEFYEYVDGEKVLIVPEVEWNHMSLFDMSDYIQTMVQLSTSEPKQASTQTLYKSLGLDYESEKTQIKQENIDRMIETKERAALEQMSLNDLRSLSSNEEIKEIEEDSNGVGGDTNQDAAGGSPLPGEGGAGLGGGLDGGDASGGGGDGGLGF